eukprot:TRINITY_DN626_c0_g1_i15.p1 TRINITY_DN626_c0_g1~~TRINITY_DN626_c0_g1_i15.p1  ORF type:complete len:495 (-),score=101.10 TRINITY_DN626_c0_g1_i15:64-1548(-)
MLREAPGQLIKFKLFKRYAIMHQGQQEKDKRLTRIRNINTLPIGVWAHWLIQHPVFQWTIIFSILVNAIILGLQSEMSEEDYVTENKVFRIIDLTILLIFIIEIIIKWIDSFRHFWDDPWNWFDFFITTASAIPEVMVFFTSENPEQSAQLGSVAKNLRILRTFRTLKAIVKFGSLRIIVHTILDAFQSMTFIMITLLMVFYIFAIFGINIFEEYTYSTRSDLQFQDKFRNIGGAFITLFQLLTLDQWYNMQADIAKVVSPAIVALYFIIWIWVGAFIFRNIFVGVMVKNFHLLSERLAKEEKELRKRKKLERLGQQLHKNLTIQTTALKGRPYDAQAWLSNANSPRVGPGMNRGPIPQPPMSARTHVSDSSDWSGISGVKAMKAQQQQRFGPSWKNPGEAFGDNSDYMRDAERQHHMDSLQTFLVSSAADAAAWDETVTKTLQALAARKVETMWPRDTLFQYLQTMESLQENVREHQMLQQLAAYALHSMHDT